MTTSAHTFAVGDALSFGPVECTGGDMNGTVFTVAAVNSDGSFSLENFHNYTNMSCAENVGDITVVPDESLSRFKGLAAYLLKLF